MSTVTVVKRRRSSQFRLEQLESDEDREHQEPLNLPEAVDTINHFLNTLEEINLKLRVEEETLYAYEIKSLLKGRRAVYDPQTGVLTVKAMASALHDAVFRFASQFYADIVDLGILTCQERRCIQVTPESHMLAGTIENAGKKRQAWHKIPDCCFAFEDPATGDVLPTVVFEAAFSEKYDDLLGDMRQWLCKTNDVQVVVVVNIEEDHNDKKAHWETEGCKDRVKDLQRRFGNGRSRAKHAPEDSGDDVESDDDMYKEIRTTLKVEDWVGRLKATIELWERGAQGPKKRGSTTTILPSSGQAAVPCIKATDLVPESHQNIFDHFDVSRQASDISELRNKILSGKRKLAYYRAMAYLRPRK